MDIRNVKDVSPVSYGDGVQKRVMLGPKQGAPTFVLRVFDLGAGGASPYHRHDWEHEIFILGGHGVAVGEKGEMPLQAGDAVLVPPNEQHCFKNAGTEPFRFVCVVPLRGEDTP